MTQNDFDGNTATVHDEFEDIPTNNSGNRPFSKVLADNMSRREVMRGSLAAAVASLFVPQDVFAHSRPWDRRRRSLVDFTPVTLEQYAAESAGATVPVISNDYSYQVLIPWGTPIKPGILEYAGDPSYRPTAAEQECQIGIGHDGMWLFPNESDDRRRHRRRVLSRFGWYDDDDDGYQWNLKGRSYDDDDYDDDRRRLSNSDGMLCINHEFGTNSHLLGKPFPETLDDVRLSQAGHGCSVVRVARDKDGTWDVVFDDRNRRITVNTPVEFDGPVAGTEYLENAAGNMPAGTVNNCGSGFTPWGTYLTCEENFNGYFGYSDPSYQPNEKQTRYGFSSGGFGYGWHQFDPRFDLSNPDYANEYNRFGWIVEIDPQYPHKPPVKHTALGNFKHEGIAIREDRAGRIHCYMGDDQRFDYCYKFVSRRRWKNAHRQGVSPFADGKLFVARFNADGTGVWLELSMRNPLLAARFSSQAELLINTRIAADIVGATPMDRPEWTTVAADGQSVYWTMTNNSSRTETNPANLEAPNSDGHIIRTRDRSRRRGRGWSRKFDWDFFILASGTRGTEGVFTDPDAAYADRDGRLFIGTDGGQPDGLQDQLTVFDTTEKLEPGQLPTPKRLFVGVASDEITGWAQTPDQRTAMTNMQHPGNGNPAATNFPAAADGYTIPRDCTIVITKKDGGVVGS